MSRPITVTDWALDLSEAEPDWTKVGELIESSHRK